MNIKSFLDNINRVPIPVLRSGKCYSFEEIFETIIKPTLPKSDTIEAWNDLLYEYVKNDELTLFIRRYSSDAKGDWTKIRRGFMTKTESGIKYVYCDNFFAHYFYTMALNDFVPSLADFGAEIEKREIPYGFRETEEEKTLRAFPKGKAAKINSNGWKLSHLYSVNENYSFNYKDEKSILFPIGEPNDWVYHQEYQCTIRLRENPNVVEYKKKMIAHFIRLVHPLNYFLSPQKKHSSADIGEDPQLLSLIKEYYRNNFNKSYSDFINLIYPVEVTKQSKAALFPYQYDFNQIIKQEKTQKDIHVDLPEIFKLYLVDGLSLSSIEKKILRINQTSHKGWVAKKILNSFGINNKHKGILRRNND